MHRTLENAAYGFLTLSGLLAITVGLAMIIRGVTGW